LAVPAGPGGRRRVGTKTILKANCPAKKQAKALLREIMTEADRGKHVDPSRITVGEHVRSRIWQWQITGRQGRNISARTAEHYLDLLAQIEPHLGEVQLQKLTTLHVEEWHSAMLKKGLRRSVSAAHALLDRALEDARKHKLVRENVAREQGRPPSGDRAAPVMALNSEQTAALLAKLEGDPWRVAVLVALYTGVRRGELLALRWRRIDLDRARMEVVEALDETRADGVSIKEPKTRAGRRTISLPSVVVEALRAHRKEQLERRVQLGLGTPKADALVFYDGGDGDERPIPPRAFSLRWGRKAAKLGMPELTWHALRHCHAGMLISAGVPITTVAARLGHANPEVTLRVYSHLYDADDSAAVEALEQLIG
jgi:integrase